MYDSCGSVDADIPADDAVVATSSNADTATPPQPKLSVCHRRLLVVCAVFFQATLSSMYAGYQALLPVLERQGVYANLCDHDNHHVVAGGGGTGGGTVTNTTADNVSLTCSAQREMLSTMFTAASGAANASALIVSLLLVALSLRTVTVVGAFVLIAGCVTFAMSDNTTFVGYIPGYVLLGVGGAFVQMTSMHAANAFVAYRGTVMTLLSCGADFSASVFLVVNRVYVWTGGTLSLTAATISDDGSADGGDDDDDSGASLRTLFLVLTTLPCCYVLFGALVQPTTPLYLPSTSDAREYFAVRAATFRRQLVSVEFVSFLAWLCIGSSSTYFFIATLYDQTLRSRTHGHTRHHQHPPQHPPQHTLTLPPPQHHHDHRNDAHVDADAVAFAHHVQYVFSFVLPFAALVVVPAFGWLLDRRGTFAGLAVTSAGAMCYQVLVLLFPFVSPSPSSDGSNGGSRAGDVVVYTTLVVFTLTRACMFACYGHVCNLMFGRNFLQLLGVMLPSAAVAITANILYTRVVVAKVCGGDYTAMNAVFVALTAVSSTWLLIVVRRRLIVVADAVDADYDRNLDHCVDDGVSSDMATPSSTLSLSQEAASLSYDYQAVADDFD